MQHARPAVSLALMLVLPFQAAQSQVRTPIGATRPLTPGALVAGPAILTAVSLTTFAGGGWGTQLLWAAVPNATGYRVNRTVTNSGVPAVAVNVVAGRPIAVGRQREGYSAVDPTVLPYTDYTYWVEAVTGPAGVLSAPSPTAMVNSGQPNQPNGLTATVGGTRLVLVRGAMSRLGAIPGSEVTWTWTPPGNVYAYEVSYTIVNGMPGFGTVVERATVPTFGVPPAPAPFTWSVPQGQTVRFCVSVWPDPDPARVPRTATCLNTMVP